MNLFAPKPKADTDAIHRVKQWVAQTWSLNEAVTVMVSELRCSEPGCPPVETVITVFEENRRWPVLKLPRSVSDVSIADIVGLRNRTDKSGCCQ